MTRVGTETALVAILKSASVAPAGMQIVFYVVVLIAIALGMKRSQRPRPRSDTMPALS